MRETEDGWKTRLVYSICAMMACASLRDEGEDGEGTVSIQHMKGRIRRTLSDYRMLYPELRSSLPADPERLEEELEDLFLSAGVVYHCPDRVAPSMMREESCGGILFQRGIPIDSISCVSGAGFYAKRPGGGDLSGVRSMFGLEPENLRELWRNTVSPASWQEAAPPQGYTEYLRLSPPFSSSYWVYRPATDGTVSLLRAGTEGAWHYFLYRFPDGAAGAMEVSPLPEWRTRGGTYRALACACLSSLGTLPPADVSPDGALVHLHLHYLLPPRELNFLKLYSWPETCAALPCDFRRTLSADVFEAIKAVLSDAGYPFREKTEVAV